MDLVEKLDQWVFLAKKEQWDSLDFQDTQEQLEKKEIRAQQVELDQPVIKETGY